MHHEGLKGGRPNYVTLFVKVFSLLLCVCDIIIIIINIYPLVGVSDIQLHIVCMSI